MLSVLIMVQTMLLSGVSIGSIIVGIVIILVLNISDKTILVYSRIPLRIGFAQCIFRMLHTLILTPEL